MKDQCEKKTCSLVKFLAVIGAITLIAGVVYAIYKYFFAPDYLEDLEEFEDDFDDFDDYFEDEDEYEDDEEEPLAEKEDESEE